MSGWKGVHATGRARVCVCVGGGGEGVLSVHLHT